MLQCLAKTTADNYNAAAESISLRHTPTEISIFFPHTHKNGFRKCRVSVYVSSAQIFASLRLSSVFIYLFFFRRDRRIRRGIKTNNNKL